MSPIEVTQQVFERFGAQDIPGIVAMLHEDIEINFYGPSIIPYAADYRGLQEAPRFFETVFASVEIQQFDPLQFLSDGDMVIVTGELRLTAKPTGRTFESDFVHVIAVRNEKWLRFRDFMNTAVAADAFAT
jgi:hypothetical protein